MNKGMNPQTRSYYNKGLKEGFQSGFVIGTYFDRLSSQTSSFVKPPLSMHTDVYSVTESKTFIKDDNTKTIGTIMDMYEVVSIEKVELFLKEKTHIHQLVNETYYKLKNFFPKSNKISLKLFTDPENDKKSLVASVFSELSVDDAFDQLDKFDTEWFADKFAISDNLFNVTIESV